MKRQYQNFIWEMKEESRVKIILTKQNKVRDLSGIKVYYKSIATVSLLYREKNKPIESSKTEPSIDGNLTEYNGHRNRLVRGIDYIIKSAQGAWVVQSVEDLTLDFSSGLRVVSLSPEWESALSISLSPSAPTHARLHSFSLS